MIAQCPGRTCSRSSETTQLIEITCSCTWMCQHQLSKISNGCGNAWKVASEHTLRQSPCKPAQWKLHFMCVDCSFQASFQCFEKKTTTFCVTFQQESRHLLSREKAEFRNDKNSRQKRCEGRSFHPTKSHVRKSGSRARLLLLIQRYS